MNMTQLLATYGYWAVLLFITIESTGIPFPGETMLLTAAIAAETTHQSSIPLVIVAAASRAIISASGSDGKVGTISYAASFAWISAISSWVSTRSPEKQDDSSRARWRPKEAPIR